MTNPGCVSPCKKASIFKKSTFPRKFFLLSMDSCPKISLVLETFDRLEGCCWTLISSSQDAVRTLNLSSLFIRNFRLKGNQNCFQMKMKISSEEDIYESIYVDSYQNLIQTFLSIKSLSRAPICLNYNYLLETSISAHLKTTYLPSKRSLY